MATRIPTARSSSSSTWNGEGRPAGDPAQAGEQEGGEAPPRDRPDRVRRAPDHRLGGQEAALHRGPDPLPQVDGREPSGISEEVAPVPVDGSAPDPQVVGVAPGHRPGIVDEGLLGEPSEQPLPVPADAHPARRQPRPPPPDPDVDPSPFLGHVPGVARQPRLSEPETGPLVADDLGELRLEGHHEAVRRSRGCVPEARAADGAGRAPRPDERAAPPGVVEDVPPVFHPDPPHLVAFDGHAGPPEEPRVELDAPDGVLAGGKRDGERREVEVQGPDGPDAERTRLRIDLQGPEHPRGDPTGAGLGPGERRTVEQERFAAGPDEPPRTGRPRRATAHDDHLGRDHGRTPTTVDSPAAECPAGS